MGLFYNGEIWWKKDENRTLVISKKIMLLLKQKTIQPFWKSIADKICVLALQLTQS